MSEKYRWKMQYATKKKERTWEAISQIIFVIDNLCNKIKIWIKCSSCIIYIQLIWIFIFKPHWWLVISKNIFESTNLCFCFVCYLPNLRLSSIFCKLQFSLKTINLSTLYFAFMKHMTWFISTTYLYCHHVSNRKNVRLTAYGVELLSTCSRILL